MEGSAGLGPTAAGPGVKSEECPVPNIPLRMHICCTQRTTQMAKLPWGCPLPARSALALPPITDHRTCIATHRASPRTYFTLHTLYTHCGNMQLVGANFVHLLMHLLPASHSAINMMHAPKLSALFLIAAPTSQCIGATYKTGWVGVRKSPKLAGMKVQEWGSPPELAWDNGPWP